MVGDLNVSRNIFLARSDVREHRGQQIVRAHALNLRWNFLATLKTQQRESAIRIPAPAGAEYRRSQSGLLEDRLNRLRIQKMKNVGQRKTVLLGQRDVQSIVCGRSLQFEVEATAETLTQGQTPGLVDPSSERRMYHQLHPAAFIEETFGNNCLLRGHSSQHGASLQNVFDHLLGTRVVQAAFFFQPRNCFGDFGLAERNPDRGNVWQAVADLLAQIRNL